MSRDFINEVGDFLFEQVFGFFNRMISELTHGHIEEYLGGYSTLDELLADVGNLLIEQIAVGFSDILGLTEQIWVQNYTQSQSGLLDILNLSDTMKRAYEQHIHETETISDGLTAALLAESARDRETGAAITDFALRRLVAGEEELLSFTNSYYSYLTELQYGTSERLTHNAQEALGFVQRYLAADLQAVEAISEAESEAAAQAIIAVALEDARMVEDWFLETVVKPISYGDQMYWAMSSSQQLDMESTLEQLDELLTQYHRWQLERVRGQDVGPQ